MTEELYLYWEEARQCTLDCGVHNILSQQPPTSYNAFASHHYREAVSHIPSKSLRRLRDYQQASECLWPWIPVELPRRERRTRRRGYRMPTNTVSVTRPSRWGNPFSVDDPHIIQEGAEMAKTVSATENDPLYQQQGHAWVQLVHYLCVEKYKKHLLSRPELLSQARKELRGKNLACYCSHDLPCHSQVLLKAANHLQWLLFHFGFHLTEIDHLPELAASQFKPTCNRFKLTYTRYENDLAGPAQIQFESDSEIIRRAHCEAPHICGNELVGQPINQLFFKFPYTPYRFV